MKLTKNDRKTVILAALKEAFNPRFEAFGERLKEHVRDLLQKEHPVFCEMRSRPEVFRYFYKNGGVYVRIEESGNACMKCPSWAGQVEKNNPYEPFRTNATNMIFVPESAPVGAFEPVSSPELAYEYRELWGQYLDAQDALVDATYGHVHREKFVEDFPGLAKHLPPLVQRGNALTLPAASIVAKLTSLGVCAQ